MFIPNIYTVFMNSDRRWTVDGELDRITYPSTMTEEEVRKAYVAEPVIRELDSIKQDISQQTYETIRGQIMAGHLEEAWVGIRRIKEKSSRK